MKYTIEIGKEYGYLTVLKELERHQDGHRRYMVRCRCGDVSEASKAKLLRPNCACAECSKKLHHEKRVESNIGAESNGFRILSYVGRNIRGIDLYECKCLKCGSTVYKTLSGIYGARGKGCIKCKPDYHFQINGDTAFGELRDGTKFIIDTKSIPFVSKLCLKFKPEKGYIVCVNKPYNHQSLHRVLLGLNKEDKYIIDHINRNRLDCRLDNLRFVTHQQNNMNRTIQRNNQSGYKGVSYRRFCGDFVARICINNKCLIVFSSNNPIECASAYNYAADLLFKEYNGFRNDVPEATEKIKRVVRRYCKQLMDEAEVATRPVVFCEDKQEVS